MSEDERVRARRLSQEHLDALRGALDERTWELFELVLARLTRLETGEFSPEEQPTKPDKRFTSTEKGPGLKPSLTPEKLPAILDPKLLPPGRMRRFDSSGEKWTADRIKKDFTDARVESGLEADPFPGQEKPEKK